MNVEGGVYVITGAASGIGAAVARRLAGRVDGLVLHTRRSQDRLRAVADEVERAGTRTRLVLGDLGESGTGEQVINDAVAGFGQLDGLVANAGFPVMKSLAEGTMADIEDAFRGNLFSFFELARAAQPHLQKAEQGRVVAVGSFTAHVFRTDIRQFPVSAASKGGLETAVRSLAVALSQDGVTVNCVVPGFIRKDVNPQGNIPSAEQLEACARIPLGRFGEPDEVAAMIQFLLARDAGYITGQCFHVNGGLI